MKRLILGDNQFFGVNHFSEERARAQSMRFQDINAIIKVIDDAYDEGVTAFMCTTHERIELVADHVRKSPDRYRDMEFYPCMPYAHKYANAVTELGPLGAVSHFLPSTGRMNALLQGGSSIARKDVEGVAKLLIDAEMKMFDGLRTPVIFLQNVVVDLLLGMGFDEAFLMFANHVRSQFGAEPGFITMNLPLLSDRLDGVGIKDPIICANMNKLGFRMCGGIDAYERALTDRPVRAVAMSVFASGAIPPHDAISWVCGRQSVDAIVFGASSRSNIRNTRDLVANAWGDLAGRE
jgi:hypothetical protein